MRILVFFLLLLFLFPSLSFAQTNKEPNQEYVKAKVIKIMKEGTKDVAGKKNIFQTLEVTLLDGEEKSEIIIVEHGGMFTITKEQMVTIGDTIVLSKTTSEGKPTYRVADSYRFPMLLYLIAGFFGLIVLLTGKKGLGSIAGMLISLGVIMLFIVPQIMAGQNPLFISIIGACIIMVATLYMAHGINQQTTIAVVATGTSLFITGLLSVIFVKLTNVSGLGSEDVYSLQQGFGSTINFQGLLLGSIIIGALGVLDDVTTTQTATVHQLADANPKFTVQQLFQRGMRVGREHIASVVNTLVLAYAGASIAVFIFLDLALKQKEPLWFILNSEVLSEEIVRTIAGSMGLMLAVPITTLLAAIFTKYDIKVK